MSEVRAYEVLKLLYDYYKDGDEDLASVDAPRSLEVGSHEWLIYMFYSCLLDYGIRSKIYHENLVATYQKYPQIFNPKYVINVLEDDELLKIMKENIHPRYPNVALKKWINLSKKLANYDNLKEMIESMSLEKLESFVRGIGGFGQKTGGLLIRMIYEANIIDTHEDLQFIPIDRHDIEISYLNGIISKMNLNEQEIRELSDTLIKCGHRIGLSASVVDKYLWNIGSTFCNKGNCLNCPLNNTCKKRKED